MKNLLIFLILVFIFCVNAFAEPQLSVKKEIDLGLIDGLEVSVLEIVVKNTGDSDLILKTVNSSCDCIKVNYPKKEISVAAQKQVKIKLIIEPDGYSGQISKSVYLFSNDPKNRLKRVRVKFKIIQDESKILERFSGFRLPVVLSAGLIDGVNPCAFSIIVFFISFLAFRGYRRRYIFLVGSTFLIGVFMTYILLGLGILTIIQTLSLFAIFSEIIYFTIAILALYLGLVSLWDYFKFKKTKDFSSLRLKLPKNVKEAIHRVVRSDFSSETKFKNSAYLIIAGLFCGFVVSILESVCTGQVYVPTIVYIFKKTQFKLQAFLWLLFYNFCFIMPLIVIFILALFGFSSDNFTRFMQQHVGAIKIVTTLVFFMLGLSLILVKLYGL